MLGTALGQQLPKFPRGRLSRHELSEVDPTQFPEVTVHYKI
jgi:hypothetical protein